MIKAARILNYYFAHQGVTMLRLLQAWDCGEQHFPWLGLVVSQDLSCLGSATQHM